ncbi:MAG: family 43 glycosylhydrolase [Bacteroidota bacterium]|nr:family 43 glycosylhydrolase [Bacteroidota bacterium]
MKKLIFLSIMLVFFIGTTVCGKEKKSQQPKTFCNPLDLPYRFQLDGSQREAADPVIVLYQDDYWLFASKSGGYWHTTDFVTWRFVESKGLPIEQYAPAVVDFKGKLYYQAANGLYTSDHPASGNWHQVATYSRGFDDPALFVDDNGRLYLFHGCSDKNPIGVVELDTITFQPKNKGRDIIKSDIHSHGWEIAGNENLGKNPGDLSVNNLVPWMEGSWMNKINGRYYLQYAAPGTQFSTYADGVYVSDSVTGPFQYAPYSPFSFKPTGFVRGIGHSCTFADKQNQYWHISTVALSVRQMFERRLALLPTAVLPDGQLVTNSYLGDYPQYLPGKSKNQVEMNSPGWMLLSYSKPSKASSVHETEDGVKLEPGLAFDERMTTWWSAVSGQKGEWLLVDLLQNCRINAIQLNFADQSITAKNRLRNDGYSYVVETSIDAKTWKTVIDRSDSLRDEPHHYVELSSPQTARYVRITNVHSPAHSLFSLYDFRIFGLAPGAKPEKVRNISSGRINNDGRRVRVSWNKVENADFYVVRYGVAPDRLYSNYQVYKSNTVDINSLNTSQKYYFTVDAVNGSGITQTNEIVGIQN